MSRGNANAADEHGDFHRSMSYLEYDEILVDYEEASDTVGTPISSQKSLSSLLEEDECTRNGADNVVKGAEHASDTITPADIAAGGQSKVTDDSGLSQNQKDELARQILAVEASPMPPTPSKQWEKSRKPRRFAGDDIIDGNSTSRAARENLALTNAGNSFDSYFTVGRGVWSLPQAKRSVGKRVFVPDDSADAPSNASRGPLDGYSWPQCHMWRPTIDQVREFRNTVKHGCTHGLYCANGIVDDDEFIQRGYNHAEREMFYIDLFHEHRFFDSKSKKKRYKNDERWALAQSWDAFVNNFNKGAEAFFSRLRTNRNKFYQHSPIGKLMFIHLQCQEAGIACGVQRGCPLCKKGAPKLSEEDIRGYNTRISATLLKAIETYMATRDSGDPRIHVRGQERQRSSLRLAPMSPTQGDTQANELDTAGSFGHTVSDRDDREYIQQSISVRHANPTKAELAVETPAPVRDRVNHDLQRLYLEEKVHRLELKKNLTALALRHEQLLSTCVEMKHRHDKLEKDYKHLLGDLRHHGIERGSKKRPRDDDMI